MTRAVVAAEAVGVVAALALAVLCWSRGTPRAEFEPMTPDSPAFDSVQYSGSWLTAAFAAVLVGGLLALDVWRRRR